MGKRKFKPLYRGKKVSELPYISEIFQSDNNGLYTKDALMCQNILQFSGDKVCFKRSELDNWLLRYNQELINDYNDISTRNTPYSTRRANKKDRLDRIFNNLVDMKLIVCSGTTQAKTINMEVETYSINKSGKLILEIIRNISLKNELVAAANTNEKDKAKIQIKTNELEISYENLHQLIILNLVTGKIVPYQGSVLKIFLTKLQNNHLFANFVDYLTSVCSSDNHIVSIPYLVNNVINQMLESNIFLDLWYESADELDDSGKEIFLHEIKLNIERRFRNNNNGYSKEYEKQCFDNRADYDKIVLEGECSSCKKFSIILLSHDGYRNWIRSNDVFGSGLKFDCNLCQSKQSCIIPTF